MKTGRIFKTLFYYSKLMHTIVKPACCASVLYSKLAQQAGMPP